MAKLKNGQQTRQLKGFWPIFGVVIVGLVACGIIFAFAYGNILSDEVNSTSSFWTRLGSRPAAAKLPVKPLTKGAH